MSAMRKRLKVLASGVAAALLTSLPTSSSAAPANGIDEIVETAMKNWRIPGTAVAVVRDGKVIFARGYGIREDGRPDRVDENTIFGIGSVTKSFNATAAAMVVDDGKVEWDKPIIDYVPSLHFSDPWITAHGTVRDLGAHRLGIDALQLYIAKGGSLDETVRTARYIKPQAPFGSFTYSNTGYAILGKVIENASGRSWDEFITERILRPLNMKNSFSSEYGFINPKNLARCWLCVPPAGTPVGAQALNDPRINAAAPHGLVAAGTADAELKWRVLPWRAERSVVPAGMLFSSVADMAQYMMFHLAEGDYQGKRLMSEAQMRQLHSPQVIIPADHFRQLGGSYPLIQGYGLGWLVGTYKGHRLVWHGGGRVGFGSEVWMFPDEKLGIVFLQNLDHQSSIQPSRIISQIANRYLGVKTSRDDARASLARPAGWKPVSARPEQCQSRNAAVASAANFAGTYRSDLMGEVQITQEDGKLSLAFEPQSVTDLVPAKDGSFTACFRGYQPWPLAVRFVLDAAGKPSGFVLGEGALGKSPLSDESQAIIFMRTQ